MSLLFQVSTSALLPTSPCKGRWQLCSARPPKDPSSLRTESQRRRNSPPKPLRRRRRRRENQSLDWESLDSVPLVRSEASPESGEDYWMDLNAVNLDDATVKDGVQRKASKKKINAQLKERLKNEVVSPWRDNWILRVSVVVVMLILAVAVFGGEENIPIIAVPDL